MRVAQVEGLRHKQGEAARKSSLELSERLMRMLLRLDGLTGGPEWVASQRKELVREHTPSWINAQAMSAYS